MDSHDEREMSGGNGRELRTVDNNMYSGFFLCVSAEAMYSMRAPACMCFSVKAKRQLADSDKDQRGMAGGMKSDRNF